jgi:ring-1,2-phenylacetyl-CoA epoxidase subunit PaaD
VVSAVTRIPLVAAGLAERRARRRASADADLYALLDGVVDPEIPVLSLWELGVLHDVRRDAGRVVVELTPTYSGCPAFEAMVAAVRETLLYAGFVDVDVRTRLSPAWTSDWLDATARARLAEHGIAPPGREVRCPRCGATSTRLVSEFAATACLALHRCERCEEPFHRFKPI